MDWSHLKRPSVWSVGVAFLALILSQFPPLPQLITDKIKGAKIRIDVPDHFALLHVLGDVRLDMFVELSNIGGWAVTISKKECLVTGSDGSRRYLLAETYTPREASPWGSPQRLLGRISLKPEESWRGVVACRKRISESEEEETNRILSSYPAFLQMSSAPTSRIQVEESIAREAQRVFERRFDLNKGNYQLFIGTISESNEVPAVRGFEFTLFESSIRDMRAATENYKYEDGVLILRPGKGVVYPRLRPMDEEQARMTFKRIRTP